MGYSLWEHKESDTTEQLNNKNMEVLVVMLHDTSLLLQKE